MAFRFQRAADELVANHEINVTPFIDVMLVLLVIFMVTAPLAMVHVPLELPGSTAAPSPPPNAPLVLSLQKDLQLSIGELPVARAALSSVLIQQTGGDRSTRIYIRADRSVSYGDLMDVMDLLRNADYPHVALLSRFVAAPAAPSAASRPATPHTPPQ